MLVGMPNASPLRRLQRLAYASLRTGLRQGEGRVTWARRGGDVAVVRRTDAAACWDVLLRGPRGWGAVESFAGAVGGFKAARRLADVFAALSDELHRIEPPFGDDWHSFYQDVEGAYDLALERLGLVGFHVVRNFHGDDDWIDGLSVVCPNGDDLDLPDPAVTEHGLDYAEAFAFLATLFDLPRLRGAA